MKTFSIQHKINVIVEDNGDRWTVIRGIIKASVPKKEYKTEELAAKEILSWDL